ncbi:MAG: biotin/lipoyl-binding protein [Proteobacteria bacterium]|nr:biotin/lipoyl-binding protein [Pseudomonadota bacterium]
MDAQQIKVFIDAMAASDLSEMEVEHDGWTLRLARGPGVVPRAAPRDAAPASNDSAALAQPATPAARAAAVGPEEIQAPMFGVVHLQQAPGEPPFVKVGDVVEVGHLLCSIEAMKVFNEVRAERAGRIAAVLATSGTEVEAGQALFTLEQVNQHV